MVRHRFSSSLSTRVLVMPHPLIDSTMEDLATILLASPVVEDDDDGEFIVSRTDPIQIYYLMRTTRENLNDILFIVEMNNDNDNNKNNTCTYTMMIMMMMKLWFVCECDDSIHLRRLI